MKKVIIMLIISILAGITCYAAPLSGDVTGEIEVKYDGKISPIVLLEGKTMELDIAVAKSAEYSQPKVFIGIFNDNKLNSAQMITAVDTAAEHTYHTFVNLDTDLENAYMKVFLWEDEMKPIGESLKFLEILKPIIYTYDSNNRLQTATYEDRQIIYNYSDNGNLIGKTIQAITAAPLQSIQSLGAKQPNISIDVFEKGTFENTTTNDFEEVSEFLSMDPAVLAALATVEQVGDTIITTYDMALLDEDE